MECPAFTLKETTLVALNPKTKTNKDRKGKEKEKEKEKPMKSFKEPTQAEKMKFENEERGTHAIESLLSKWSEPSKTMSHAPQDVDEVKEDFKQHLKVHALQAAQALGTFALLKATQHHQSWGWPVHLTCPSGQD